MKEKLTHKPFTKKKKLIMILTPICSLVVAGVITTTAILASGSNKTDESAGKVPDSGIEDDKDKNDVNDDKNDGNNGDSGTTSGGVTVFADPVKDMKIIHTFGFYYNNTLNSYYTHGGIDIAGEKGSDVYATLDGKISAVYTGDVLSGNQIVLESDGGIKTVYSFIDPLENLKVGQNVVKGQVIGTIAEATGNEYKDGAHIHVEVYENGVLIDPETYLSSTEK